MIYSMTAFARSDSKGELGYFTTEIRSINHRYLEVSVYLPDALRALEMPIRELIRKKLGRGKIECTLRFHPQAKEIDAIINESLAKNLCDASEKIAQWLNNSAVISATDILRIPGVMMMPEANLTSLQKEVMQLVDKTLQILINDRAREGEELKQLFLQRTKKIATELKKVRARMPDIIEDQKDRLNKRFLEAKVELDPLRLEQEMLIMAQKVDIAEEIERAETHLTEMERILKEGGVIGRRLDFILQELNREANTMGSKSIDITVTHAAVEMKVLLEQIREQVQNVE